MSAGTVAHLLGYISARCPVNNVNVNWFFWATTTSAGRLQVNHSEKRVQPVYQRSAPVAPGRTAPR